jgi:hypothetical protein
MMKKTPKPKMTPRTADSLVSEYKRKSNDARVYSSIASKRASELKKSGQTSKMGSSYKKPIGSDYYAQTVDKTPGKATVTKSASMDSPTKMKAKAASLRKSASMDSAMLAKSGYSGYMSESKSNPSDRKPAMSRIGKKPRYKI